MKKGILFRPLSLWIGVHYSPFNKRWCINIIPCITIWICKEGGNMPVKKWRDIRIHQGNTSPSEIPQGKYQIPFVPKKDRTTIP